MLINFNRVNQFAFLFMICLLFIQQAAAQNPVSSPPSAPTPTIDQILDKYVQFVGGKSAAQAITSRVVKGTISAPALGANPIGSLEIYAKAPNKELTLISTSVFGNSKIGFNGAAAWSEENGTVKDLPGFSKREADFYLPFKLREIYPKIEFKGVEKIGSSEAYRLEAPRGGTPKRWYFDTENGSLLRTEVRNAEGKLMSSEDYEDYRAVDGVKIAFTTRRLEGGIEAIIKLTEVKQNVQIDDAKFDKPKAKSSGETASTSSADSSVNTSGGVSPTKKRLDYPAIISELKEKIPPLMSQRDIPGAAIALIDGEQLIWAEGFGFTDRSKKVKVTADTLFNLKSVSKTYTAAGFLIAATKGWLKLDDPFKKYVPAFSVKSRFANRDESDKITFRHLLSHRSGISREAPLGNLFDEETASTLEEHIKSISDGWLTAPVGERYSYSNPGIDLVGYALAVRSQKSFGQFMKDELFAPLAMTSSTFDAKEALRHPSLAKGHSVMSGEEMPENFTSMIPSGGMYSSVKDMAKFISFQLSGGRAGGRQLISEKLLKEMSAPQFAEKNQVAGYGLGLGIERWKGATLVSHDGGGNGYNTFQAWIPEYQIGVVVLTNRLRLTDFLPEEIGRQALLMMTQAKYGALPPDKPLISLDKPVISLSAEHLRRLEGTYNLGTNASIPANLVIFKVEDGSLFYMEKGSIFNPSDYSKVKLEAHSATEFSSAKQVFTFRLDKAGKISGVSVQDRASTNIEFLPFNDRPDDPPGPNKPEWQNYTGTYTGKVIGIPIEATVSVKNGYLYVSWGDGLKLTEYAPSLFFRSDGEAVSFRDNRMWLGNRPFVKSGKN
ncbi:MAG TPA: serine hydrolase [Pyrinomonadaceae bacterium]|nr:serine hydrolase [Pyrinomonadaceae bacterium]